MRRTHYSQFERCVFDFHSYLVYSLRDRKSRWFKESIVIDFVLKIGGEVK